MKQFLSLMLAIALMLLASCSNNSHIPNISIFEEIPSDQLSEALKAEEGKHFSRGKFEEIYPGVRKQLESMSEIDKAKVAHLTYRELINAMDVMNDSVAVKEIQDEWQLLYDSNIEQAKREAASMESDLLVMTRTAITRASLYGGYLSYSDAIRRTPYARYLKRIPIVSYEDFIWNYDAIIKDKINSEYLPQFEFIGSKQLERIKDKYPEAYHFLLIHQSHVNDLINSFYRSF